MTRSEYNQLLGQIPKETRKQYGFNEPFDLSGYKCIHTDEYDYYPELDCCMINDVPVVWERNDTVMSPEIPNHLIEMKKRVKERLAPGIYTVYLSDENMLKTDIYNDTPRIRNAVRKKGFTSISKIDGKDIHYDPDNIELKERKDLIPLISCLFYAKDHNMIGIIPDKDEPVEEWMDCIFVKEKADE